MNDSLVELQQLTHSMGSCFKRCRRKFQFEYVFGWRPDEDAEALTVGTVFHKMIEFVRLHGAEHGLKVALNYLYSGESKLNRFTVEKVRVMIEGYVFKWNGEPPGVDFIESEGTFAAALRNPETERPSRNWCIAGRRDGIVKLTDGRTALWETKTTKSSITDDRFWSTVYIDGQINHYHQAARELDIRFDTTIYDVIRKPGQIPGKATPEEDRKYTKPTKKDPTPRLYKTQRENDETPAEYYERVREVVFADLDEYFVRKEIPRLTSDLKEYAMEAWGLAKDIQEAKRTGRYYRTVNRFNCGNCSFWKICSGQIVLNDEVPEGFRCVGEVIHGELV